MKVLEHWYQVETLKRKNDATVERSSRIRRFQTVDLKLRHTFAARLQLKREVGDAEVNVEKFRAFVDVFLGFERRENVGIFDVHRNVVMRRRRYRRR